MDFRSLLVEHDHGMCRLTLNRPERLNTINIRVGLELPPGLRVRGTVAMLLCQISHSRCRCNGRHPWTTSLGGRFPRAISKPCER